MKTPSVRSGPGRGSALVAAAAVTTTLATIAFVLASLSLRAQRAGMQAQRELRSFYAAEAGLSRAWVQLESGGGGSIGTAEDPARIGGLDYWVEATPLANGLTSLVATARDGSSTSRLELLVQDERGGVQDFGAFAEEQVTLRRYSMIDSYDSTRGSYASQVHGDHAGENGNVGSNANIEASSYARVYGYTQHGRDDEDSISLGLGVSLWDGFGAALREIDLLPVAVPRPPYEGDLVAKASMPETIGPGAFEYASLLTERNSRLTVEGPCELVITGSVTIHGSSTWIFDTSNGPIRIYALGNFRLGSDAILRTTVADPALLTFFLGGTHDAPDDRSPDLSFSADAQFYGTVYAPRLSVRIENTFEVFGSVKAKWLEIGSGARVHFDENLASGVLDPGAGYGILAWRPLRGARPPAE